MFQERGQAGIIAHCPHQLLQILDAAISVGGFVGLPHGDIARFLQHHFGQLGMAHGAGHVAPTGEIGAEGLHRAPGCGGEIITVHQRGRRKRQRQVKAASGGVHRRHRLVAQAAFRHVDDAFKRQRIGRRMHQPQIGQRITHFGALIETEPADDAIGQADGNEAVFEQARLELGAHQYGHVVQGNTFTRQPFGLVTHQSGFLRPIPNAGHFHALTAGVGGEQRLAQPAAVVRDQRVGSSEDVGRGAVILFQPDHLGAGKIRFEPQDIGDFGAAPAVDRLIIIADAG